MPWFRLKAPKYRQTMDSPWAAQTPHFCRRLRLLMRAYWSPDRFLNFFPISVIASGMRRNCLHFSFKTTKEKNRPYPGSALFPPMSLLLAESPDLPSLMTHQVSTFSNPLCETLYKIWLHFIHKRHDSQRCLLVVASKAVQGKVSLLCDNTETDLNTVLIFAWTCMSGGHLLRVPADLHGAEYTHCGCL